MHELLRFMEAHPLYSLVVLIICTWGLISITENIRGRRK